MATFYYVAANIDSYYMSADKAAEAYRQGIQPTLPESRGDDEDSYTRRVCLAPTVEQCMTSIGLSVQCRDVMPILILEFELDPAKLVTPTKEQVPDVDITGEVWSLVPLVPIKTTLKWIDENSLHWENGICTKIDYVEDLTGRVHWFLE